jgi:hypothetical protein
MAIRQSIVTKYIAPSNVKGSRVSATSTSGERIIIGWDDTVDTDTNHTIAAAMLAEKLGWSGRWEAGAMPNGCGFVNVDGTGFTVAKRA